MVVAPVRERGLKYCKSDCKHGTAPRRSREGAWIEIERSRQWAVRCMVAPVRERGLK